MTRIEWVARPYSAGVDRGVLYAPSGAVAWDGLTSVEEKVESESATTLYFDGSPYATAQSNGDYEALIEAFTYPEVFDPERPFNFSFREGERWIHLVWNATTKPTSKSWRTRAMDTEASLFTWDISTVPEPVVGIRPVSHFVYDTELAGDDARAQLEAILYGTTTKDAYLPSPQEVYDLLTDHASLRITDNGDGTWTAEGPAVVWLSADEFKIDSPGLIWQDEDTFTVRSW